MGASILMLPLSCLANQKDEKDAEQLAKIKAACQVYKDFENSSMSAQEFDKAMMAHVHHVKNGDRYLWEVSGEDGAAYSVELSVIQGKIDSFYIPEETGIDAIETLYQISQNSIITLEKTQSLLGEPAKKHHMREYYFAKGKFVVVESDDEGNILDTISLIDCP